MATGVLPIAAAAAGTVAVSAYLNAKYHIAHDLAMRRNAGDSPAIVEHVEKCFAAGRPATYHLLQDQALKNRPNQVFLIYEDRSYTYAEFFRYVTRVGNWLMNDIGIQRDEIVALDGINSPEYIILWFALEGIGAAVSYLNNNLTGNSLVHCVKLSEARYLLVDRADAHNAQPCEQELSETGIKTLYYDQAFVESLTDDNALPDDRLSHRTPDTVIGLLYTSGSTGLPKALPMNQVRSIAIRILIARHLQLKPGVRLYTCMPLYHGSAHGLATTPVITAGATLVLGRKFSHSTFWPEVRASNANIIQYVGELCRYLLNAPPSPLDKQHNVHMAWGNGIRPDVWEDFRERFGIPVINELYAATDGMGTTLNCNKGPFGRHAVGVRGIIWQWTNGLDEVRVRIDPDTEELLRDSNGLAIRCKANEAGEVIHRIADPSNPTAGWSGYWRNDAAENKRYIRNVFKKGDMWFRTGDMHRQDAEGRVYFVDRLGDTFRWKSENASTNEVSDVLGAHPQIAEANVYGVTVPNADGRCGMAGIVVAEGLSEDQFDLQSVADHVLKSLPRYAVPIFIRLTPRLDYTGTLKMQKGRLKKEGIDPTSVAEAGDKLYWLPAGGDAYLPFRKSDFDALQGGKVRL